jgi:thiol:disulfide interchange protein DsbA
MRIRHLFVATLLLMGANAQAQLLWQKGVHYQEIASPQRANAAPADKIEVVEVFSYACPYCDKSKGDIARFAASLPADAKMDYVHASFRPDEAWPMFQRAFYAARELGIAEALHEAMFDALWRTMEVPLLDKSTGRIREPLPTIEDAARFYARMGSVKKEEFLRVAKSPAVEAAMKHADALVKAWRVPGTPTLVVNGRYIINNEQPYATQARVAQFLIGLERTRLGRK